VTDVGCIEKLQATHDLSDFDCGREELNRFLLRHALQSQNANSAQTYVALSEGAVRGYYSLTVGSVGHAEATERVKRSMPRYPIPVLVLARLAVHRDWQGQGLGRGLPKDALVRTERAADIAGIRALLVHAKDEHARAFYTPYDFEPSPTDPDQLFLLVKDIRRMLRPTPGRKTL
jgi:GNAT superfamily N-acetyltransferase